MKEKKLRNPFKHFCITVGNLPSAYLNSMTYYEALTFMVKFLTTEVIPTVNNNSKVVEELQEYVAHYFDNLDVQEEINNKLDDMAESGELVEVIGAYLNAKSVIGYDTVADLKLADNLINGSYVKTLGYTTINDNGGSYYKIVTKTEDDVVNETTIISLSDDNLVAKLIVLNNTLQAEQFGAIGDNDTDDSVALQDCIDMANTLNCKVEMNKKYLISTTLNLYSNLDIKINYLNYTGDYEAIKLDGISYVNLQVNEIHSNKDGISLKATSSLNNNNKIDLNYCYCSRNGIALIATYGIAYNKITFNNISPTNYGIYVFSDRANYGTAFVGENTIYGGRITRGVCGIYANGTGSNLAIPSLKIYNVCFETPDMAIYLNNTEYCLIDNPRYQEMGSSRTVLSINGDCRNTVFNGVAPMYANSIVSNITYPTSKLNPVLINCPIAETGGAVIGKGAKLYSSGMAIVPIQNYSYKLIGNEDYEIGLNELQYQYIVVSNDSTLKLNNSYGTHNIDNIIVKINSEKTLVIYDKDDNVIFDNTSSTEAANKYYKLTCIYSQNEEWIIEEIETI